MLKAVSSVNNLIAHAEEAGWMIKKHWLLRPSDGRLQTPPKTYFSVTSPHTNLASCNPKLPYFTGLTTLLWARDVMYSIPKSHKCLYKVANYISTNTHVRVNVSIQFTVNNHLRSDAY